MNLSASLDLTWSARRALTLAAGAALAVAACGCAGSAGTATPSPAAQAKVQGTAHMGPLAGSSIAAFAINPDGSVGTTAFAATSTDENGAFALPQGPMMLKATGGTYTEEATGTTATLSSGHLRSAYVATPASVVISPYTEAVVAQAIASGGLTAANLQAAQQAVQEFLGGVDPLTTAPAYVTPGTTLPAPNPGNQMAFALGAESQARSDFGIDAATSVQTILAQAANGDTLTACNQGAGTLTADGTENAPLGDSCALTIAARTYALNSRNNSGITSIDTGLPPAAKDNEYVTATAAACSDRATLLATNVALFDQRRLGVQAHLGGATTAANWSTAKTISAYGPTKTIYGSLTAPAACSDDTNTFYRELVMAAENYWVDQGMNYCHHHIPGWLPPDDAASKHPKYRISNNGSTSGSASGDAMTCTPKRFVDGSQVLGTSTELIASEQINWHGVDCSNFTSWIYDFVGLAGTTLESAIAPQSCSANEPGGSPGVLLDINSKNVAAMIPQLRPGDLLYITQVKPSQSSGGVSVYNAAHVITWTGKRWSDLQKGSDRASYDLTHLGAPGSRLGADINSYLSYSPSLLGTAPEYDPWMIIDSHYAGPAYRPFVVADAAHDITADWYAAELSAVRRIIGADEAADDPLLQRYLLRNIGADPASQASVLASVQSGATVRSGDRLLFGKQGGYSCQRIVTQSAPSAP